jgi:hypothetical protein
MPLHPITDSGLEGRDLVQAITELQQQKTTVAAGAAAATSIAIAGLGVDDTLRSVIAYKVAAGVLTVVDVTANASIFSAGNLRIAVTDTTGAFLVVDWFDKSAL